MMDRRSLLLGAPLLLAAAPASPLAWDFTFPGIDGTPLPLGHFRGQVLLVANTASFCGYTYQYEGLQKLHVALQARGFSVIGVPSGDFDQESDSNDTVRQFCEANFGVTFPLAALSHVRGDAAHPFYRWVQEEGFGEPRWNFTKVLVGRDGRIREVFGAADRPGGARVQDAIERALVQGA